MKNNLTNISLHELFLHFLLTGLALLLFSGNLFAAGANLAWDGSNSSNVGGYKISYGQTSGTYASTIDVGNATSYAVSGLQEGAKYYFAVKAYDSTKSTESVYSNEVNMTVPTTATTALTADFTASTTSGVEGLSVNFTPVTTGTITSWKWGFPGSYTPSVTNSTAKVTTATYPTAGTYSVSLTVTGSSGSVTKTYPNLINVTAAPAPAPAPEPTPEPTPDPETSTSSAGLVAAYGFEEASGATVADASGKGNHGTISNAVRTTSGHSGKALQFNGTNAWVTVKDSAALDLSTSMTLEAWVYPTSLTNGGGNTLISKEQTGGIAYTFYVNGNKNVPLSSFDDGGYRVILGPSQLPINQWIHLVSTYDGQYQRLYVNGLEVARKQENGLIQQSAGVLRIGGNSVWGQYFQGTIDEVRIYNRALTATEVAYNLKTAVSVSNPQQFVMGDKTKEPWVDYKPQGTAQAYRTTPQKSGVVTSVQVYLDASSTATEVVAGIYKNYYGHPRDLIAKGKLSTLKPGAWNSVSIPATYVTAAQPYWIAVLGTTGQVGFLELLGSGTGRMESSSSTALTTLPWTWTGTAYKANSDMSVFGNGY